MHNRNKTKRQKSKVEEIEEKLTEKKTWEFKGEIKASSRPVNSLIDAEVEFEKNEIIVPITKEENQNIFKYVCQRFKEKTFDNFEFKTPKEEVVEEVYDIKPIESNKEIFELFDKIETEIKKMVDYGNKI